MAPNFFDLVNIKIEEFFNPSRKITFLAGAGISIDPPSCLLSAKSIVDSLIKICCPEEEASNILRLNDLRYELVIEGVQNYLDPELRIMNFFDLFEKPNILHQFLAEMIINGHYVVTTNFDYLIEFALLDRVESKEKLMPIINRDDYLAHPDIGQIWKSGKYPLIKIHGSKKNLVTGQDTTGSLVTTLSALGKERGSEKTFAIEPYKMPVINNITNDKTLVVLGYSGSDDFDIGPTLNELNKLKAIIWVNHVNDSESDTCKLFKLNDVFNSVNFNAHDLPKVDQVLVNIGRELGKKGKIPDIYRLDTHTSRFVEGKLWHVMIPVKSKPIIDNGACKDVDFDGFLQKSLGAITDLNKYAIASWIYFKLANFDDVLRNSEKGFRIAEKLQNEKEQAQFLNRIAMVHAAKNDLKGALHLYETAISYSERLHDDSSRGSYFFNSASCALPISHPRLFF